MDFRDELADGPTGGRAEGRRRYAEKIDRAIGTRCFLTRIDGRAVSGCVLWAHGEDAQLDTVETLSAYRRRGAASATVGAAAEAARASGATWIHLYTLAESGPIAMYRRLGFDDVGEVIEFVRA
jgi:predicted GNAT family acetyltransferase